MIRLHATQKLFAKLPLDSNGRLKSKRGLRHVTNWANNGAANDTAESPLSGWHANLLTLQRRQCVLFVHDATRFPLFVPALKKDDFAELDFWFTDGLMNTLLKMGADEAVMARAHQQLAMLGPLLCDRETDRSVQGTLNQMGQELEHILRFQDTPLTDLSPYRLSIRLAQPPRKVKGQKEYLWPIDAMFKLLGSECARNGRGTYYEGKGEP
jgi:hypothetical protein